MYQHYLFNEEKFGMFNSTYRFYPMDFIPISGLLLNLVVQPLGHKQRFPISFIGDSQKVN